MLSRTANSLFWLARSVERMEYAARLLNTAQRMAATGGAQRLSEWRSAIIAAGCEDSFFADNELATREAVVGFMAQDPGNPSSIRACLTNARQNARAVRTAITSDMWEAINGAWIEAQNWGDRDFNHDRLSETLDWVKQRATLFNGAYRNTMLRTDGYHFTHLGTHIERADNTARILDVKYHILLPSHEDIGGAVDYVQWSAILRSVSAARAYHYLYKGKITPWQIAELLILRPEMPRSLRSCLLRITETLHNLETDYFGHAGPPHMRASATHAQLRYSNIKQIFQTGLHEFLTDFIDNNILLGQEIQEFYNM